ncbi:MAG TPA: hypothetical protein PLI06_01475 [Methanofastidiosum sp.]|nr:hypothetical protein [Methanofastidiosum sp.]HNU60623.1 hypothetical protein [Methanofastidiosum sp.]HOI76269.1 hypothetical protein [Methanofastidiosum sp.]
MSEQNLIPFKVKKTFSLHNKTYEEGRDYDLHFLEVEVLINEGLVDIVPLNSVDYRKMLKEEGSSEKMLELEEKFYAFARISQRYLKSKENLSQIDKKAYSDSATALRNFLRFRAEKILKALLIENQKIEVHESELIFSSLIGGEISKWIKFNESIVKGEKYEI